MIKDLFFLSLSNLTRRKTRSYLTMIGIFIGIAAVVALVGLGEGLRVAVLGQFGFIGSDILTIKAQGLNLAGPPGTGAANPLDPDLVKIIRKVDGVESSFSRYISSGRVEYGDSFKIGLIGSIPLGDNRKIYEKMMNLKMSEGRPLVDGDGNKVILGYDFSEDNEDSKGIHNGDRILIEDKSFEVAGIIEKKGSFIIDSVIVMNEDKMKELFDIENPNIIIAKVSDVDLIPNIKKNIEKVLRKERHVKIGEEDFSVETAQSSLDQLDSILFAVQLFVIMIASISLLVGGIGITNTMYTSVLERTKEIGIFKSIGATNKAVFTIFLFESGLLGMVGGLVGIAIGSGIGYGIAYVGRKALGVDLIQAHIGIGLIFGALAFSFVVGIIAGILPAIQAAKKNPVDSLRHSL